MRYLQSQSLLDGDCLSFVIPNSVGQRIKILNALKVAAIERHSLSCFRLSAHKSRLKTMLFTYKLSFLKPFVVESIRWRLLDSRLVLNQQLPEIVKVWRRWEFAGNPNDCVLLLEQVWHSFLGKSGAFERDRCRRSTGIL